MVLTIEEAKQVLWMYHTEPMQGGHSGLNNTRVKISKHYHWKGIVEDVTQYVSNFVIITTKNCIFTAVRFVMTFNVTIA